MGVVALLLAAGRGERFGRAVPKAFVPLAGRPLLVRAAQALWATPALDAVLPVVSADRVAEAQALLAAAFPEAGSRLLPAVAGGAERQDSVAAGLAALPPGTEWVAVHDAARALVRPEAVSRVVAEAKRTGAALLAVPARDTIKRVAEGRVLETPARESCWAAQTPQVFRVELLAEGLAKAAAQGFVATDDAQLVERLGVPVAVVPGDPDNWKLTHAEDLALAEALWARRGEGP